MPYIYKVKDDPGHLCKRPSVVDQGVGSVWLCSQCNKIWQVELEDVRPRWVRVSGDVGLVLAYLLYVRTLQG